MGPNAKTVPGVSYDLNRCGVMNDAVAAVVDDLFEYHKWDEAQIEQGRLVRCILADAVKTIIANVPPCPTRTVAIRKLVEARMDCNAAITHRGKY